MTKPSDHERNLLVTGGSRGIGAATVRLAAARGWNVAINYRDARDAAEEVARDAREEGVRAFIVKADVSVPDEVEDMFAILDREFGRIDDCLNNAGIVGLASRLDAAKPETIRAVIDTNVTGAILVAREAVRRISTRHGGRGGSIVNVSSVAASLGGADAYVWYAASKGAIDSFTTGLAREVAAEGIRVNSVVPGIIDTEIHATTGMPNRMQQLRELVPMKREASAEEVAEAILFLMSESASYVAGAHLKVSGGR